MGLLTINILKREGMAFELAKTRINILDIHALHDTWYVVNFEYQYINKDKSRVWQKDVILLESKLEEIVSHAESLILEYVKKARTELEG